MLGVFEANSNVKSNRKCDLQATYYFKVLCWMNEKYVYMQLLPLANSQLWSIRIFWCNNDEML